MVLSPNGNYVALFIDFENIRNALRKQYYAEPDPQVLIAKAMKYGTVSFAAAYADFSRQPEWCRRQLEAAGIEPVQALPKRHRSSDAEQPEQVEDRTDFYLLIGIFEAVLDRPHVKTFVLMTGDSDFVRIVAKLRTRLDKRVVIAGVPGSISVDLVRAAGGDVDPVDVPVVVPAEEVSEETRRQFIRAMAQLEWEYPTFNGYVKWFSHPKNELHMAESTVRLLLEELIGQGVLFQQEETLPNGSPIRTTRINRTHLVVAEAVPTG
ncbi:MAG: NYN domain-containing protein [Chloroflexi bacterium]|nr:NYN domain-containing protein [Chloroflexota bacterium]